MKCAAPECDRDARPGCKTCSEECRHRLSGLKSWVNRYAKLGAITYRDRAAAKLLTPERREAFRERVRRIEP